MAAVSAQRGSETTRDGVCSLPDGGRLAYQVHGPAEAAPWLLLVRPLGGTAETWGAFRDSLSCHFAVVSFDVRGTGRSSTTPTWTTTKSMASDALHLLDHLAIDRTHLHGQSLGGMVAMKAAAMAPRRVDRLVLASTAVRGAAFAHAGLRHAFSNTAAMLAPAGQVEPRLAGHVLSPRFRRQHPELVDRILEDLRSHPTPRLTLLRHAIAGAIHDARADLAGLDIETLVLAGSDDHLLGAEAQRRLARALPRATLSILEGAGHDVTLERPRDVAERVKAFLDG